MQFCLVLWFPLTSRLSHLHKSLFTNDDIHQASTVLHGVTHVQSTLFDQPSVPIIPAFFVDYMCVCCRWWASWGLVINMKLDLHGFSEREARAAVLCGLRSVQLAYDADVPIQSDFVIITGMLLLIWKTSSSYWYESSRCLMIISVPLWAAPCVLGKSQWLCQCLKILPAVHFFQISHMSRALDKTFGQGFMSLLCCLSSE